MKFSERRQGKPAKEFTRETPLSLRAQSDADDDLPNDGWTIDGYGAVFNSLTVIDSWEGVFRERIAPKSMKRSFSESLPIMQFDHGRHASIGSIPIADVKFAREDVDADLAPEGGAHIGARIFQVMLFEPLRAAIAARAISKMSFRFSVVREKWETADGKTIRDDEELFQVLRETWYGDVPEDELPIRTLQELKVPEMGPVVWPAYQDTSVGMRSTSVRSILDKLDDDPELRVALTTKLLSVSNDADEGESDDSRDAQQGTPKGAAEHPSKTDDAQRGTPDGAAKHPSQSIKKAMSYTYESQLRELAKMHTSKGIS